MLQVHQHTDCTTTKKRLTPSPSSFLKSFAWRSLTGPLRGNRAAHADCAASRAIASVLAECMSMWSLLCPASPSPSPSVLDVESTSTGVENDEAPAKRATRHPRLFMESLYHLAYNPVHPLLHHPPQRPIPSILPPRNRHWIEQDPLRAFPLYTAGWPSQRRQRRLPRPCARVRARREGQRRFQIHRLRGKHQRKVVSLLERTVDDDLISVQPDTLPPKLTRPTTAGFPHGETSSPAASFPNPLPRRRPAHSRPPCHALLRPE